MKYNIEIKLSALKALKNIDAVFHKKLKERIKLLETDPRHIGSIKLKREECAYRTRVGNYRIIYEIYDAKVLIYVINVEHRKDVYK